MNKTIRPCETSKRGNHNWKQGSQVPYTWKYFSSQRMVKELGKKSTQASLDLPPIPLPFTGKWLELKKQEKVSAQARKGCLLVPTRQSWRQKVRTSLVVIICIKGFPKFNPWVGRSPGGGHGNPLRYSCLENPMDRGAWWAAVHGVTKSRTWLKRLSMHACALKSECSVEQRPSERVCILV